MVGTEHMMEDKIRDLESRIASLEKKLRPAPGKIDPDIIYTMGEAASLVRCSLSMIYDLAQRGDLATVKVSTRKGLRVKGSDLIAFLDSRREGGPTPSGNYKRLGL